MNMINELNRDIKDDPSLGEGFMIGHSYFCIEKENGAKVFNHHIKVDLQNSSYILNKDQYYKYLRVLNVTLVNRDLSKYLQ